MESCTDIYGLSAFFFIFFMFPAAVRVRVAAFSGFILPTSFSAVWLV